MKMDLSRFLQSKFNMFIYSVFGWRTARTWIFFLGKLYFYFNKEERLHIENAVREGMGFQEETDNVRKLTKEVFRGIYCHYYEKLFIAYEKPKKAIRFMNRNITDVDLPKLRSILKKGRGAILVTGHYGAIEYIPTFLAMKGLRVSMIAKFKTPHLKRKVYAQAKDYGIRLIDGSRDGSILRAAARELHENRVLITQCDEVDEWRPSKKKTLSFMGRRTGLDRTINVIQKRTGAEIIFGVIHRYHLRKYELKMVDYSEILSRLEATANLSVGEAVLKFLERSIYANPEQWYQWKKYFVIGSAGTHVPTRAALEKDYPLFVKSCFKNAQMTSS